MVAGAYGEKPKFETFPRIQIIDTSPGRIRN